MGIKFTGPKVKLVKPKIRLTAKCLLCGRQVTNGRPHKCPKRKTR
jgi:hypothetical protein